MEIIIILELLLNDYVDVTFDSRVAQITIRPAYGRLTGLDISYEITQTPQFSTTSEDITGTGTTDFTFDLEGPSTIVNGNHDPADVVIDGFDFTITGTDAVLLGIRTREYTVTPGASNVDGEYIITVGGLSWTLTYTA